MANEHWGEPTILAVGTLFGGFPPPGRFGGFPSMATITDFCSGAELSPLPCYRKSFNNTI